MMFYITLLIWPAFFIFFPNDAVTPSKCVSCGDSSDISVFDTQEMKVLYIPSSEVHPSMIFPEGELIVPQQAPKTEAFQHPPALKVTPKIPDVTDTKKDPKTFKK
jgi:hypothetical protein